MKSKYFATALSVAVAIGLFPATAIAGGDNEGTAPSTINSVTNNADPSDTPSAAPSSNTSNSDRPASDNPGPSGTLHPPENSSYHVIRKGHVDIFEGRLNGKNGISLAVGDDSEPGEKGSGRVYRTPESVVLDVLNNAWKTPAEQNIIAPYTKSDAAYLPLAQKQNIIWPGWDLLALQHDYSAVDIVFDRVQTPKGGNIVLASINPGLGSNSARALLQDGTKTGSETFYVKAGAYINNHPPSHTHAIWAFTKPGIYRFYAHLRASKNGSETQKQCTRTAVYTWRVYDRENRLPVGERLEDKGSVYVDHSCPRSEPENNAIGTLRPPELNEITADKIADSVVSTPPSQPIATPSSSQGDSSAAATPGGGIGNNHEGAAPSSEKPQCLRQPIGTGGSGAGGVSGSHTIPTNTHVHPRWIFTAPGQYQVRIRQTVTLPNGKTIAAPTTLKFNVGGAGNANSGHFDLGAVINNGQLKPMIKDDRKSPAKQVDPSTLTFGLGAAAKTTIPKGMEYIGPAGSTVWQIPEVQDNQVPWLGANTMSLGEQAPKGAIWTLESVSGPGRMVVLTSSSSLGGKPTIWFQSGGAAGAGGGQKYEWRTPDGQPCTPSAADLARTGNTPMILGIGILAFGITVLGGGMLFTRKILSPQSS